VLVAQKAWCAATEDPAIIRSRVYTGYADSILDAIQYEKYAQVLDLTHITDLHKVDMDKQKQLLRAVTTCDQGLYGRDAENIIAWKTRLTQYVLKAGINSWLDYHADMDENKFELIHMAVHLITKRQAWFIVQSCFEKDSSLEEKNRADNMEKKIADKIMSYLYLESADSDPQASLFVQNIALEMLGYDSLPRHAGPLVPVKIESPGGIVSSILVGGLTPLGDLEKIVSLDDLSNNIKQKNIKLVRNNWTVIGCPEMSLQDYLSQESHLIMLSRNVASKFKMPSQDDIHKKLEGSDFDYLLEIGLVEAIAEQPCVQGATEITKVVKEMLEPKGGTVADKITSKVLFLLLSDRPQALTYLHSMGHYTPVSWNFWSKYLEKQIPEVNTFQQFLDRYCLPKGQEENPTLVYTAKNVADKAQWLSVIQGIIYGERVRKFLTEHKMKHFGIPRYYVQVNGDSLSAWSQRIIGEKISLTGIKDHTSIKDYKGKKKEYKTIIARTQYVGDSGCIIQPKGDEKMFLMNIAPSSFSTTAPILYNVSWNPRGCKFATVLEEVKAQRGKKE